MDTKNPVETGFKVPDEWTFRSGDVARSFDSHVREQLPWYELATGIVAHVARCYVPKGGRVIDVGASTGNVGRALAPILKARAAHLTAIESAEEFKELYDAPGLFIVADAVDFDYARQCPDLIVCFLALQFIPVARRRRLIAQMCDAIALGGAVVVFDKMIPRPGYAGTVSYRLTLAAKREAGASPADIVAKELSIMGVQRPLDDQELAGFVEIFRFGDFAGFVYERAAVSQLGRKSLDSDS
jgi:tRNA (cmo5U34)-methyltransferase